MLKLLRARSFGNYREGFGGRGSIPHRMFSIFIQEMWDIFSKLLKGYGIQEPTFQGLFLSTDTFASEYEHLQIQFEFVFCCFSWVASRHFSAKTNSPVATVKAAPKPKRPPNSPTAMSPEFFWGKDDR